MYNARPNKQDEQNLHTKRKQIRLKKRRTGINSRHTKKTNAEHTSNYEEDPAKINLAGRATTTAGCALFVSACGAEGTA